MSNRTEHIIDEYRSKVIEGKTINLVPFTPADSNKVVEIRNRDKNKYFLHQTCDLTVEDQNRWYESYLGRKDDIYWCIYNKSDVFIGTIRIYDIDEASDICDQGSFMIAEEHSKGGPYALEAEVLTLDFIFDVLQIHGVINEDRADNKVMNNLSKKLGFEFKKKTTIRDVEYNYYLLTSEAYKLRREKFVELIDYFGEDRL